jgi:predicted DNA-binding protein
MNSIKATFTLPDNVLEELNELSDELGKKKSHIVKEALDQYFDTMDLRIAKKRSDELKSGKKEAIPFEKIKEEIGI